LVVLSLLLLLLLPGLVIVRAPWTAVPFLSLSFWMLSWWWLPAVSGRQRFVVGALAAFALLASLRLLKPLGIRRPSWPTALVVGAALLRLLPFALQGVAPGAWMSFHSTAALLMVWRDGLPASYEPLLPIQGFGAYAPGLPALAADLTLLSGLPAYRATFLFSVVAAALLAVALFGLLARLLEARVAAVASVASLGLAPVAFDGPPTLALALALSGWALLLKGSGRSPPVAAGVFLGAALGADAATAAVVTVLGLLVVARRPDSERLAAAAIAAVAVSVPLLIRSGATLADTAGRLRLLSVLAAAVATTCWIAGRLLPSKAGALGIALLLGAATLRPAHAAWITPQQVTPDDFAAMAWLRDHAGPFDVVCNGPRPASLWIPALAEREIAAPELPAADAPKRRHAAHQPPCAFSYASPRAGAPAAYQNASVAILVNR
jgi:hypothetical protein